MIEERGARHLRVGGALRSRLPRIAPTRPSSAIAVATAPILGPLIGAVGVAVDGARAERSMCDAFRAKVCDVAGIAPAACCGAHTRRDVRGPDTATTTRALSIAAHAFTPDPLRPAGDRSVASLVSVVPLALIVRISRNNGRIVDFDAIRPKASTNVRGLHATAVQLLSPSRV